MKFKQLPVIQAEYKITTPLFLGGALDAEVDAAHFRNASFKGALRFWWRAIHWGNVLTEHAGDHAAALKALHQRESELFGHAADGKDSAQSLLQITSRLEDTKIVPAGAKPKELGYLLGLGLWNFKTGTLRPYLSGGRLRIEVRLKPSTTSAQIEEVARAMTAVGIFGGLGSRARKGLGSLAIQWLEQPGKRVEFPGLDALRQFVHALDFSASSEAPLSAFSSASRVDVVRGNRSATAVLADIGLQLQLYRDGTIPGKERQHNFSHDRELAQKAVKGDRIAELPARAVFGLPHNYFWKDSNDKLDISPEESSRNRRASPLLIHIHEFPDGQCVGIQTLLPSRFLPEGDKIALKAKRNSLMPVPKVDFQVIHRYLDGFPSHEVLRNGR